VAYHIVEYYTYLSILYEMGQLKQVVEERRERERESEEEAA
jgi:hypothetical protein